MAKQPAKTEEPVTPPKTAEKTERAELATEGPKLVDVVVKKKPNNMGILTVNKMQLDLSSYNTNQMIKVPECFTVLTEFLGVPGEQAEIKTRE